MCAPRVAVSGGRERECEKGSRSVSISYLHYRRAFTHDVRRVDTLRVPRYAQDGAWSLDLIGAYG